jgi:hypothetical protein
VEVATIDRVRIGNRIYRTPVTLTEKYAYSGMLRRVALVRTDVSEERSTSIISSICSVHQLLVTDNAVPSSSFLVTLLKEALSSSETSVLTKVTWRHIPEDGILRTHRC